MGMYTELVFKADIKSDLPADVRTILHAMFSPRDVAKVDVELPDHPFFKCPRWQMIGACSSYYHIPWATSRFEDDYIFSRSDLKNYDDEINKFIDWVKPYIAAPPGHCIGWSWYEESNVPTLILM